MSRECKCMFCGKIFVFKNEKEAQAHMENCVGLAAQLNNPQHTFDVPPVPPETPEKPFEPLTLMSSCSSKVLVLGGYTILEKVRERVEECKGKSGKEPYHNRSSFGSSPVNMGLLSSLSVAQPNRGLALATTARFRSTLTTLPPPDPTSDKISIKISSSQFHTSYSYSYDINTKALALDSCKAVQEGEVRAGWNKATDRRTESIPRSTQYPQSKLTTLVLIASHPALPAYEPLPLVPRLLHRIPLQQVHPLLPSNDVELLHPLNPRHPRHLPLWRRSVLHRRPLVGNLCGSHR